jgi:uncharacterized protein YbbK (DUF523 family)
MDKDRVEGAAHQVKGAVKEAVGKVTGDAKTQAEGAAEKCNCRDVTTYLVSETAPACGLGHGVSGRVLGGNQS